MSKNGDLQLPLKITENDERDETLNECLFVCFLNPTILEISGGSDQSPETWCLTPMKGLMLGVLK